MKQKQFDDLIQLLVEHRNNKAAKSTSIKESNDIRDYWNNIIDNITYIYRNNLNSSYIYEPFNDILKMNPEDIDSDYIKTFLEKLFRFKKIKNIDFKIINKKTDEFLSMVSLPKYDDHMALNILLAIQNVINSEIIKLVNKRLDQES